MNIDKKKLIKKKENNIKGELICPDVFKGLPFEKNPYCVIYDEEQKALSFFEFGICLNYITDVKESQLNELKKNLENEEYFRTLLPKNITYINPDVTYTKIERPTTGFWQENQLPKLLAQKKEGKELFIYAIGARGYGKTYGIKKFLIDNWLKTGEKFCWVRFDQVNTKKLLKSRGMTFFQDLYDTDFFKDKCTSNGKAIEKNGSKNYINSSGIFINRQHAGYLLALSEYYNDRGNDFGAYHLCFDEILQPASKVRRFDVQDAIINEIETTKRLRSGVVFFLANNMPYHSSIFEEFGDFSEFGDYKIEDDDSVSILNYMEDSEEYRAKHEKSASGILARKWNRKEMVVENINTAKTTRINPDKTSYLGVLPSGKYFKQDGKYFSYVTFRNITTFCWFPKPNFYYVNHTKNLSGQSCEIVATKEDFKLLQGMLVDKKILFCDNLIGQAILDFINKK